MGSVDGPEGHARLSELVARALEMAATERDAYLTEACADDLELRREVDSLLATIEAPVGPLRGPTPGDALRHASDEADPVGEEDTSRQEADLLQAKAGDRIGPYRLEEPLGRGGMGVVWRGWDERLDRPVALKTIAAALHSGEQASEAFVREARLLARLQHPHVATVFDLPEVDGIPVLVMELLDGEDLSTRLSRGPLDIDATLQLGRQVASALDLAHCHDIVHRDLKPANVRLLGNGDAKVLDFGLARRLDPTATGELTDRTVVGTPGYMSPEQVRGEAVDERGDLFALGAVLYECLTGQRCFPGRLTESLSRTLHEPPDWSALPDDLPDVLHQLLRRSLEKSATARLASAREAGELLGALAKRRDDDGSLPSAPGASQPEAPPCVLPAEPDEFVGREQELAELTRRFDSGARLLSILGPGGMGKTRLALRHAWRSFDQHPEGTWFCDLSETTTREEVLHVVANVLSVPPGNGDPVEQVGHAIAGRGRCLLVLDNLEQVVAQAAPTIERWLARAPEARFLVTSRERLHVAGEEVMVLEPLASRTEGAELFLLRARAQGREIDPQGEQREDVEEIAQVLDGLPLAIELAAARSRLLTPAELRSRLSDRLSLLSGPQRVEGRRATLRATIDWSWKLLEPWERAAIAQCSVFEGPFTLAAAEDVLDLSSFPDAPWPMDVVQLLVDKSLLRSWVPDTRNEGRLGRVTCFGTYASIRAHAAERLTTPGSLEEGASGSEAERAAQERHGRHLASFGTDETLALLDTRAGEARNRNLELQLTDLIVACRRAVERDDAGVAVPTLAAAGHLLGRSGPVTAVVDLGRRVLRSVTTTPPERGRAHLALGTALDALGEKDEAREHHESALTIARDSSDQRLELHALAQLGNLYRRQGRSEEAGHHYDAALRLADELGDRGLASRVQLSRGTLLADQGELSAAREEYTAAVEGAREVENRRQEGLALGNLATLSLELGRLEEAREECEAALEIHREVGERRAEGSTRGNLGIVLAEQGRLDQARAQLRAALRLHRELGNRRSEGLMLAELAALDAREGHWEEARSRHEEALLLHRETGNRRAEAIALGHLGNLCHEQGRFDEAEERYGSALTITREVGDSRHEGIALGQLGMLLTARGRADGPAILAEGEALLRRLGNELELTRLLVFRGSQAMAAGDRRVARESLLEAKAIAEKVEVSVDSRLGRELTALAAELGGETRSEE
ncbi:MAG: tetratricopeptide repeat protein [Acidobacteriota bacterium]